MMLVQSRKEKTSDCVLADAIRIRVCVSILSSANT